MQSLGAADQRMMGQPSLTVDLDLDGRCRGRPDRKVDAPILDRRPEISTGFRRRALGHRHEVIAICAAIFEQHLPRCNN